MRSRIEPTINVIKTPTITSINPIPASFGWREVLSVATTASSSRGHTKGGSDSEQLFCQMAFAFKLSRFAKFQPFDRNAKAKIIAGL